MESKYLISLFVFASLHGVLLRNHELMASQNCYLISR